jgi:hypothetical protein
MARGLILKLALTRLSHRFITHLQNAQRPTKAFAQLLHYSSVTQIEWSSIETRCDQHSDSSAT